MKKTISIILAVLLVLSASIIGAAADSLPGEPTYVYVTIADQTGKTVITAADIAVTDIDDDGKLTINDALYCAHEIYYEGGAAAGYATKKTEYGLSLDKLWGSANGSSYGYYVNNVSAWSLDDPIKGDDYIAAFCYTDLKGWSDHYSYFDRFHGLVTQNEEITLTYSEAAYDKEWNPITLPVEGATITINGEKTDIKTDKDGKATVKFSDLGLNIVSAQVEGKILVAPVFRTYVIEETDVYVTITDKDGNIPVAAQKVAVTDIDLDNDLTINDALYCAHEKFYEGGADAGYATKNTEYGLSLDKLWGNANGGSYGYYLNGSSAWSLLDSVNDGEYLYAFTYTDLVKWSDKFSTFDIFAGSVDGNAGVELTLTYVAEYDEYYSPVFKPLAGAEITIDGEMTGIKTDEDGKANVTFSKNGTAIVSAKSADVNITPPVFKADVSGIKEPDSYILGDADSDGIVAIIDATAIQRHLADLSTSSFDEDAADVDKDEKITILDATAIQRHLADLPTEAEGIGEVNSRK